MVDKSNDEVYPAAFSETQMAFNRENELEDKEKEILNKARDLEK